MRTILILTAGYGEGHNSAARAVQAACNERADINAEIIDLFALHSPRFNQLSRNNYLRLINSAPRIWSAFYRWLDQSAHTERLLRILAGPRRLLAKIIAEKNPVAIVSTYPVYAWLLNLLRREGLIFCPHFTVVTDALTINSLWYRTGSAGWFVPDEDSAAFLHQHGLPKAEVHVSGFPVALTFADRSPINAHLDQISAAQPPRVLFMVNSGRARALATARALLNQSAWQITITAGRDPLLLRELHAIAATSPANSEILGWTNRIPELLMTHHVVISKAGGATTQESLNALCPMVVSQIVPGQEEGNYELIRRHALGTLAESPEAIIETLERVFAHDATLWRKWRANLVKIARPNAARQIVDIVITATHEVPPRRPTLQPAEGL